MQLIDDLTIGKLLRETAAKYPDRTAIMTREKDYTYSQLDKAVDLTARRLLALGIKRGDHIGVLCETEPVMIILFYALARIGAVSVLYNTSLKADELASLVDRSDTKIMLAGDGYKDVIFPEEVYTLLHKCPKLEGGYFVGSKYNFGLKMLKDVRPVSTDVLRYAESAVDPQDTAQILFTSGTTSLPKMVMGSQYARANCGRMQAHDLGATKDDVFLVALPTFHCFSLSVNVMAACSVGAALVLPISRKTVVLLSAIQERRATILSCVPTLFHAMMKRADFKRWDVSSLRVGFIGGSPCPPAQFKAIEEAFGMTVLSSLGQTEATAGLTTANIDDPLEVRATTLGHMMDFLEGKIVDIHTGEDLPTGQVGEICARGYVVMQGYYKMPEETAKTIDKDGWLHTGDMGWFGDDGYLRLTGRVKDLIIRGGENISPAEIEDEASKDPRIEECRAIGVPDKHYGEEVCLCVVLKDDCSMDPDELRAKLSKELAAFKVPKYILMMRSLPKSPTGKVKLNDLKAAVYKRLNIEE